MRKFVFPFLLIFVFIHGCDDAAVRDDSSIDTFFTDFDKTGCEVVILNGREQSFESFVEYACVAEKIDYIKEYAENLNAKYPGVKSNLNEDCGYWHYPPFGYVYANVDTNNTSDTYINIPDYKQDYPGKIIVRLEKHQ